MSSDNCKAGSKFKLNLTKYNEPSSVKKQRLEQELNNLSLAKSQLIKRKSDKKLPQHELEEINEELYKINNKITNLNTEIANFDNASINTLNTNTINTLNTSINNLDQILKGDGRFNKGLADEISKLLKFNGDLTKVFDKKVLTDIITEALRKNQNISKTDIDNLYNMLNKNTNETFNTTQTLNQLKDTLDSMSDSTSDVILDEIRERLTDIRDINNYKELMLNTFGITDSDDDITKIRLIFLIINELDRLKGYRFATKRPGINASLPLIIGRVEDDISKLHELFNLPKYNKGDYISGKDIDTIQMMNNIKTIIKSVSVNELNQMLSTLANIDDIINKYDIESKDLYIKKSDEPFDFTAKASGLDSTLFKISPESDIGSNILYTLYRIEDILNRLLLNIEFNEFDPDDNSLYSAGFDLDKYHELVKNNNDSIVDFKSCFNNSTQQDKSEE